MKAFAHSSWGHQVFELQGDLGALLRQATFFEGVGELVVLADAEQEFDCVMSRCGSMPFRSQAVASALKFTCAVMSCSPGAS